MRRSMLSLAVLALSVCAAAAEPSAWEQLAGPQAAQPKLPPRPPSVSFGGIKIEGPDDFLRETLRALALLERSGDLPEVAGHIAVIRSERCSGIDPTTRVYGVGDPTWKAGTIWYAGTIAHDSRHSRLYADALAAQGGKGPVDVSVYSGAEAEKKCLAFQRDVLERLGAGQAVLDYITRTAKAPTYQNIGAGKPDVCADRKW